LRELALILRQRGIEDAEIRARIDKISEFIDGLSAEEKDAVLGGNPDVAAIADRLFAHDPGAKAPAQNAPARHASAENAPQRKDDFKITSEYKEISHNQDNAHGKNMAEIRRRDEEKLKALKDEAQKPRKKQTHASLVQRFESERRFWVIFFCCMPIIFVLLGAIISVFAILFFGLIALILLLVAALAAAVAIGTAVALIGITYGVIQFFTQGGITAVALYEAGMGILAAGITMLVGVLIYNAAIRFVPFIMKKLRVLLKFVFKKLGALAEYLKGVWAAI
jgi:hypothetical protein